MKKSTLIKIFSIICVVLTMSSCSQIDSIYQNTIDEKTTNNPTTSFHSGNATTNENSELFSNEYDYKAYSIINDNIPEFDSYSYSEAFEYYGKLDKLGRCTACFANIGPELMTTQERGAIGSVKPSGWQTVKYDCVDGKYLYNRCHLIGYQLTAENANEQNLITGTRFMNVEGMLPFENEVAKYIQNTNNHVLYRVTPDFKDDELVARGVQIEAYSLEDNGKSICFNVYCYNIQPYIEINYKNGESKFVGNESTTLDSSNRNNYIVNISTKKFHKEDCEALKNTKSKNKKSYYGFRENLISNGYSPCGQCNP